MPFKPHPTDPTKVIYKTSEYWIPKPWQGLTDEDINKSWEWAQIQYRRGVAEGWEDVGAPRWKEDGEYRIKPEPKPDYVKIFYLESHPLLGLRFSEEINPIQDKTKRISCVFDGESGKLKSAKVI